VKHLLIFVDLVLSFVTLLIVLTAESTVAATSILAVSQVALLTIAAPEKFGVMTFDATNDAQEKFGVMVQRSLVVSELEPELRAEAEKLLHVN